MKKSENTTNYSIKSKLVAAAAMLLVATIMVVSSTYAWFTLSTAPEITGISTAVGANGALEMLLLTKDDQGWVYGTGSVNDKSAVERNNYWGNLVDLKDSSYGSQAITLYPSKLNINDGKLNLSAPLQTPVFGSDGRVENLANGGSFAKFNGNNFMEDKNYYGFRGIGVASGLSERQQAFRSAISSMATASYNAQNEARKSLDENGNSLADIAVRKAMDDNAKFTKTDVATIGKMITGLENALKQVEDAYIQAIVAYSLGKETGNTADTAALATASTIKNAATIENAQLNDRLTAVFNISEIAQNATTIQAAMLGYNTYKDAVDDVKTAKEKYTQLNSSENEEFLWNDIKDALTPLANVEFITINNIPANEVMAKKNQIVSDVMGGKGVQVAIPTNGGVYADIADLCGDYTVDIEIPFDSFASIGLSGEGSIKATMKTNSELAKAYLTQVSDAINTTDNYPQGAAAGELPLTELYGYVIDLAFRTNAAQSNLLLQTEAADRIYNDNNNDQTMGSGSTMTFKSSASDFTADKVKALMSNLRVVFYSTVSQDNMAEIYATAKLDVVDGVVEDANGITAKLYIYKTVTATKVTLTDTATSTDTEAYKVGEKYYVTAGNDRDFYVELTDLTGKTITVGTENAEIEIRDNVITALNQNEIKHISALVYLDGENIENDDVAANGAQSITGSLNLQFASSATLTPMEYGNLHTTNATPTPDANN